MTMRCQNCGLAKRYLTHNERNAVTEEQYKLCKLKRLRRQQDAPPSRRGKQNTSASRRKLRRMKEAGDVPMINA